VNRGGRGSGGAAWRLKGGVQASARRRAQAIGGRGLGPTTARWRQARSDGKRGRGAEREREVARCRVGAQTRFKPIQRFQTKSK
jgi:hypothetical protein